MSTNFYQEDPRRRGDGDGNDSKAPIAGEGDMTKAVYDSNDDGRVDSADFAETATSATNIAPATTGFNLYYGRNDLGVLGFWPIPSGGGGGASTFLGLSDTPASYLGAAGYQVVVNGEGTGLEFVEASAGSATFLDLTDTPSDYTGQAGKLLSVNGTEDGVEFIDPPATPPASQELTVKTTANTGELPNWAAWIADTSGGALTRAMPSSPTDGMEVTVHDVNGNAATNNITLTVVGPTTITQPTLDLDNQSKKWRYDSGGDVWDLVFSDAPSTGGGGGSSVLTQQVTIPAADITGNITDFPLVVSTSMGVGALGAANAGATNVRLLAADGTTEIPSELGEQDVDRGYCRIHATIDLTSGVDFVFFVEVNGGVAPTAPVTDPFADYDVVVSMWNATQAAPATDLGPSSLTLTPNGSQYYAQEEGGNGLHFSDSTSLTTTLASVIGTEMRVAAAYSQTATSSTQTVWAVGDGVTQIYAQGSGTGNSGTMRGGNNDIGRRAFWDDNTKGSVVSMCGAVDETNDIFYAVGTDATEDTGNGDLMTPSTMDLLWIANTSNTGSSGLNGVMYELRIAGEIKDAAWRLLEMRALTGATWTIAAPVFS